MNKRKYLRKLRKALGRIPESEKEELIEYYAEMIDESYERGKTTREIFASIESPERVAANYFNENEGLVREEPRRRPRRDEYFSRGRDDGYGDRSFSPPRNEGYDDRYLKKKRSVVGTLVLLPLYIVLGLLALVMVFVCIAAAICMVGFWVGGLYTLVMSFGLIPAHGTLAITQMGAAVALFGVAVLMELAVKPLAWGSGALFRVAFRMRQRVGTKVQSRWIATLATGLVLLIVGGAMGGFGFRALGGDWHNLAVVGNVVKREQTVDLSSGELTFSADNLRVSVLPAQEGEGAKLVYYETDELPLEYSAENGNIALKSATWGSKRYWQESFRRGIMFSAVMSDYTRAELYLPADYAGNLAVTVNNGALTAGGFDDTACFANVTLTTDNGVIAVDGFRSQMLSLDTDNGYIRLDNVRAEGLDFKVNNGAVKLGGVSAKTVLGSTQNGAITLDRLESESVTLKTDNGTISGSLVGNEADYRIETRVSNGSCNLNDKTDGEKQLYLRVGNGSIKLHFVSAQS